MAARLYPGQVSSLAEELVHTLTRENDIEVESHEEVRLDFEAVLKEYLRRDRDLLERAKSRLQTLGASFEKLGRIRAQLAKEMGVPAQDEALPYLVTQLLQMLFHSKNVAEVFADDVELRKKITPILKKHMESDSDIDKEVRSKIRNLQEGTANFEVEYERIKAQIKRVRGLS